MKQSSFWLRTAIHAGVNSRGLIPELFRGMGATRVVLFSDRGLDKAGIVQMVEEAFTMKQEGSGPELAGIYLDISQDAESSCVNAAVQYARKQGADALLAVGGGSVLDTVKGVKYSLFKGLDDIKESISRGFLAETFPHAKAMGIPHISIPTTAGTGSEVSPIAVIYNEDLKVKANIINPFISSDIAVLDPELTVGLPPFITAFTGMDALTHAIEALASPNATSHTDAYALQAIRLIEKNLVIAVNDGTNLEARMEMLQASLMGITAFSFALHAIPVHNFAHAYGALFRIPHGLANAVFLPVVMEHLPDLYIKKAGQLAEALAIHTAGADQKTLLHRSIEKIRQLRLLTGLPEDFSNYKIPEESLKKASAAVAADPSAINFPMSTQLIETIGQKVVPS
ncbi:iron-containing alcohol dehydrogenase [Heyndrickxia acidicola]|uniref:Iron-containing alcohol dehydrogenase n=1 Tax=Heyndrickxia acidicola TaxID=209389 RepID=A0ABU6MEJ9_9BACI|nr:iron-containing alcohol dehydrogenase [Heyndrickxia acidicola]MED1201692.1 iron-containing alcohol dehydrogenase [Heyndrickxia acidicola]